MGGYLSLLQQYQRTSKGRGVETVLLLSWERHWNMKKEEKKKSKQKSEKANKKVSEM